MIISQARLVRTRDVADYAWSGLRRYLNVAFVEQRIRDLHQLDKKQRENARKQARQIRYCLMQAREYADAAMRVSLVTKPTLFYYSTMCLALAEVLLKQSGNSSLDRAREQHRHHGLTFSVGSMSKGRVNLQTAASALRASPAVNNGQRFGTFELWHRTCREMPISGKVTNHVGLGTTTRHVALLAPADVRLKLMPLHGLSLFEVLVKLPALLDHLAVFGIRSDLIRGSVSVEVFQNQTETYSVLIHPTNDELRDRFMGNFKFDPNAHHLVEFHEIYQGGRVDWRVDQNFGPVKMAVPHGSMWNADEVRFWPKEECLNELGFYYLALFVIGNYARYYPDRWIADVEDSTELALTVDELLKAAEAKVPLLTLSELERVYLVPDE